MFHFTLVRYAPILLVVQLLSACSSGAGAIVDTATAVVGRYRGGIDSVPLNPQFRYLRVTVDGRPAFMALGYEDAGPDGITEVWYSAEREVLRLRAGRLVGATGLTREWREVFLPPLPSWQSLAISSGLKWVRTRDLMPGYRFGVVDELHLIRVPAPARSELRGLDPGSLAWFQERVTGGSYRGGGVMDAPLAPALYAVDLSTGEGVVQYAEQCLASDLCITWQRWSAQQQSAAVPR